MRAIRIEQYGGLEVLQLQDVPLPRCEAGHVVLRVEAAGVNFADTRHRAGNYPWGEPPPTTLGLEACGAIEEVGKGVSGYKAGDRVAVLANGAYAEYARAPASMVIPLPEGMDSVTGAAFPLQALTAYHLTHTAHAVQEHETVLVHAAAGGVGLMLVQMAKLRGARVIGTTSSQEKAKTIRELGGDEVINYTTSLFDEEVLRLTQGAGVDVAYDAVGRATFERNFNALKLFGHLVSFGAASGIPEPVQPRALYAKSLKLSGFVLYAVARLPSVWEQGMAQVVKLLQEGKLRVTVHRVLPLEEAAEAHRLLESRGSIGKIVLRVGKAAA